MSKLRDWFDKTPTVDGPTKEELRKATKRLKQEHLITKTVNGGSHAERPPKTDKPLLSEEKVHKEPLIKNINPPHWNKELREKIPPLIKKDIMKEIEWEDSEEGAKELRHLFAMWHLNDEVWQRQRRKAINLAVYGTEDPFNEKPYWHLISFNNEFGYKLVQYPIYEEDNAKKIYERAQKAVTENIIDKVILIKGYQED